MTVDMQISRSTYRRHHGNGTFSDYVTFHIPADSLHFQDIDQSDERVKLQDAAHLRYVLSLAKGVKNHTVVAFARLVEDRPVARVFPDLAPYTAEDGEVLLSANSFITYTMRCLFRRGWVRYEEGIWETAVPDDNPQWQRRGSAVLNYLSERNSLYVQAAADTVLDFTSGAMDVNRDLLPVAGCAFLSDYVGRQEPELAFNTSFFLLEFDDVIHRHCALGEAHGFWMVGGVIHRPPLFRRGAIYQTKDGKWHVGFLAMNDLSLALPSGLRLVHKRWPSAEGDLPYAFNEETSPGIVIYNRYYGVKHQGRVLGYTPKVSGCLELSVIDRRIVGWKEGGGLVIPHNGFVISFAPGILPRSTHDNLLHTLRGEIQVTYQFVSVEQKSITQGLQTGPILLLNGHTRLTDSYLEEREQFWPSRTLPDGEWQIGVVPTGYKTDVGSTRAGRAGLGIDPAGDLVLVLAPGVTKGLGIPGVDSFGATLLEIAAELQKAGAISAVNLDGGGSTQAYFRGEQAIVPGDRRDLTGHPYERMVPSAGLSKSSAI